MHPYTIISNVVDRIQDIDDWSSGGFMAEDLKGNGTDWDSGNAKRWCLVGAVLKECPDEQVDEVLVNIFNVLPAAAYRPSPGIEDVREVLYEFNDSNTHGEVMRVLRAAESQQLNRLRREQAARP